MHLITLTGGFLLLMFGRSIIGESGCPLGWRQFDQSCYMMVIDRPLGWSDAQQACHDVDSQLSIANSQSEDQFMHSLHLELIQDQSFDHRNVWLGCMNSASDGLVFFDGGQHDYMNMQDGQDFNATNCCCLKYKHGQWALLGCQLKRSFICERKMCTPPRRCFSVNPASFDDQATPYCLLGHTFKETIIKNPIQCCLACSKDPNCRSFNLSGKMCQLNNVTISQVNAGNNVMENCVYYEMSE
ncbi:galactose-specific lectin nattectin-like [Asterias amurensis]|uniref:galactose-specific lectin nattectin-like n=1 Tax=Asterias amurensis TaxID=7602 RepID=UPI003AB5E01A